VLALVGVVCVLTSTATAGDAGPATVTLALSTRALAAGSCLGATITVEPDGTGHDVQLQRATRNGWRTIAAGTLGAGSQVLVRACFGWSDLGRVRLRARSSRLDADTAAGVSAAKDVKVVRARWMRRIDRLSAGHAIGVSVGAGSVGGNDGATTFLYRRRDARRRTPASNQKLLLSMALLARLGPGARVATKAGAIGLRGDGSVRNLWITGAGDPEVGPAKIRSLADRLADAGLQRVRGRVLGSRGGFARDWWARGWKRSYRRLYIPLPTALTWQGNRIRGRHIRDPERRAAAALTEALRRSGVRVRGRPGDGRPNRPIDVLAQVASAPLADLLRRQNVHSKNFHAEVLGKVLGAARAGAPGTIAKGARAIEGFTEAHHVRTAAFDASGLSSRNRVAPGGLVRLLWVAEDEPWYQPLRTSLPSAGQGTLRGRLRGVGVRAKTGTLSGISALSGWVWLDLEDRWVAFSILSRGMSKTAAVGIEDRIVRAIAAGARVPD
jgi:D-alanyl-D-alanine carboxypeptidase/D-alanyl-D-alanine-endopeptidase (penicillin-binding protein 4)